MPSTSSDRLRQRHRPAASIRQGHDSLGNRPGLIADLEFKRLHRHEPGALAQSE